MYLPRVRALTMNGVFYYMKLIKHMFVREIGNINNQHIIANTLTAFVGVLYEEEKNIVLKWTKEDNIIPVTDKEKALYDILSENKFLVHDDVEEEKTVADMLTAGRNTHRELAKDTRRIILALTYMCNFACPYCFEKENCDEKKGKVITKEQIDKVFDLSTQKIENIELFGGEPLLPITKDIVSYIFKKAPNEHYSVTTNGYYLDEFIPLFKTVHVFRITVTLDGKRDNHNKTRKLWNGDGTYDKVIGNVEKALESGLPISIRMNLTAENKDEGISLREELRNKYADYYATGKLTFDLQTVFQQDEAQKTQIYMDTLYNFPKNSKNIVSNNLAMLSTYPLLRNLMTPHDNFIPKYCHCDSEERLMIYDAYGDMYSCPVALGNKNAVIGTYYPEYTIKNESMLNRNIESVPECRACIYKFICGGGCANEIVEEGKSILRPNCHHLNIQIDHLIAFAKRELDNQCQPT